MGSNYPPGVSGSEWQIAGPDREESRRMECGVVDATLLVLPKEWYEELRRQVDLPAEVFARQVKARSQLRNLLDGLHEYDNVVCPFDDEVEVAWFRGVGSWTCPL